MKHPKLILSSLVAALAAAALTILLATAALAEQNNYGELWQHLSPAEKELLLIGYARGLRSAESEMHTALWNETFCDSGSRRRLLERASKLSAGLGSAEDIHSVVECLDAFYAEADNRFIDWTSLVGLAHRQLEGASEEQIEAELARLRQCADHLEEIRSLDQGQ